jgi:16S rRNA (guanine966-N2)-methyltransferase
LRIVAGSRKGHRIAAPKGAATRPTEDRVREAAFALVGPVENATVLDLFAGSGALGLEALSRGASRCVFVEHDRGACRTISLNLEKLRLTGVVVCRDVVSTLRKERAQGHRYDLVLVDAPYGDWAGLAGPLSELIPAVLENGGLAVVETLARVEPELSLDLVVSRRYGSARITLFRKTMKQSTAHSSPASLEPDRGSV